MEIQNLLALKIKIARTNKNLTQLQLGELLEVTEITVNRWEKGGALPRLQQLFKLSELLDKPVYWFFEETDKQEMYNELTNIVKSLNVNGVNKLLDYASDLMEISKYKK